MLMFTKIDIPVVTTAWDNEWKCLAVWHTFIWGIVMYMLSETATLPFPVKFSM
jgi:hypothetical protein